LRGRAADPGRGDRGDLGDEDSTRAGGVGGACTRRRAEAWQAEAWQEALLGNPAAAKPGHAVFTAPGWPDGCWWQSATPPAMPTPNTYSQPWLKSNRNELKNDPTTFCSAMTSPSQISRLCSRSKAR